MYEKERQKRDAIEILKLAGCLDNIDDDVAKLCLKVMPKGKDKLISIADLMNGVQEMKDKLKKSLSTTKATPSKHNSHKIQSAKDIKFYCKNPACCSAMVADKKLYKSKAD